MDGRPRVRRRPAPWPRIEGARQRRPPETIFSQTKSGTLPSSVWTVSVGGVTVLHRNCTETPTFYENSCSDRMLSDPVCITCARCNPFHGRSKNASNRHRHAPHAPNAPNHNTFGAREQSRMRCTDKGMLRMLQMHLVGSDSVHGNRQTSGHWVHWGCVCTQCIEFARDRRYTPCLLVGCPPCWDRKLHGQHRLWFPEQCANGCQLNLVEWSPGLTEEVVADSPIRQLSLGQ
jgi:hypothetical protein